MRIRMQSMQSMQSIANSHAVDAVDCVCSHVQRASPDVSWPRSRSHGHAGACHATPEAFEAALDADDRSIPPSQLYAYAAVMEGVPYANGAPNLSADIAALEQLAIDRGVPIDALPPGTHVTGSALHTAALARQLIQEQFDEDFAGQTQIDAEALRAWLDALQKARSAEESRALLKDFAT